MFPRRMSRTSLALVAPLGLTGLLLGAAVLAPASRAARVEHALVESDFEKDFKKALDAKDAAAMQKLVKDKTGDAVIAIVDVAERIAKEPSEDLETLHAALREAWKVVHKTEFAEKVYRFFSSINSSTKKNLGELRKRYESGLAEWENNQEKKDPQNFDLVEAKLRDLVDYFDQEGDLYHAGQCAWMCARSLDELLRSTGADLPGAYKYYARVVELREKLDLKDSVWDESTKRKSALAARGFDKKKAPEAPPQEPGGGQPGGAAPTPTAPATPIKVPLTFELVTSPETFQRPTYCADDLYEAWQSLALNKKDGNKAAFLQMSGSPTLIRTGASEIKIDVDGDGQGEEKLGITGNMTPVKLMLGKGEDARPWGFLAMTGIQQDTYQGIQVNTAPVDDQITLYTLGAASVVGNVAGTQLRLIDETFDGIYGSQPLTYGFVGISDEGDASKRLCYQPDFDTLVVGTSKHARPYSELVDLDGKWYRIAVGGGGRELVATPASVETGTVKLVFHGSVPPSTLIVQGKSELEKCFFDITDAGAKGVQLPIGTYQLFYGELRKGKKKQMQKCIILPPKSPPTWGVRRGETTTIELGGPFDFDCKLAKDGDKLTIVGRSVRVVGKAGERYERVWNAVPIPEAGFRKKGSKGKAAKYEKMPKVLDNEGITKLGWDAPWSPLDLSFDVKGQGPVEVQLVMKTHDFFGKIESTWKE